ncbi:peroxidase-related enzyme [soil metagenome]
MPHIHTISYDQADHQLKEVYDQIIKSRGKLADVHKIQSLNPDALVTHMALYMSIMFGNSPLKRYQREMMAVVVSAVNKCEYCINHHEQALLAYWKDEVRTGHLQGDRRKADLTKPDELLCELAEKLTKTPGEDYTALTGSLKEEEFTDRAILDAVQVIAYFNFVNRLVLGLGVTHTDDEMKGYKY